MMPTTYDLSIPQHVFAAGQVLLKSGSATPGGNTWYGRPVFADAPDNETVPANVTRRAAILTPLGCPAGSFLWKATLTDVEAWLSARGVVAA